MLQINFLTADSTFVSREPNFPIYKKKIIKRTLQVCKLDDLVFSPVLTHKVPYSSHSFQMIHLQSWMCRAYFGHHKQQSWSVDAVFLTFTSVVFHVISLWLLI